MLVFTLVLVVVDSSLWPLRFFYLTIASIVILNMSNGFYQNSIFGVAARLPMRFTNAVILGNNICGTLVSLISIGSLALSPDPRLAAFYYFLSALLILLFCLVSYFLLPLSRFYRFYYLDARPAASTAGSAEQLEKLTADEHSGKATNGSTKNGKATNGCATNGCATNGSATNGSAKNGSTKNGSAGNGKLQDDARPVGQRPPYLSILRLCGTQCFNVFFTFLVTLILFPTVLSDVRSVDRALPFLPAAYFTPVVCYLAFNLSAMLGNLLPSALMRPDPKNLQWFVLARLAFIPFFLACNYKNHRYVLLIASDWAYLLGVLALGLSHGHLSSLAMMYAAKSAPEQASIAGMLAAFCLVFGIFSGISLSFLF